MTLFRLIKPGIAVIMLWINMMTGAMANETSEYQLKAAFLYNFTLYTKWPELNQEQFNFCIFGDNPFGNDLDPLEGRKVGDYSLHVRSVESLAGISQCQMIFIPRSFSANIADIRQATEKQPILIVTEIPEALSHGSIINLLMEEERVVFEVNTINARQHDLKLSSRLLRLAREVIQ